MFEGKPVWFRLSVALAVGAAVISTTSLAMPQLYRDVDPWLRSVWTGNDIVTLAAAVPVLAATLFLAARGSRRAELLAFGGIGYLLYNYAYYLLGARINALFPAYVVLWVGSAIALMLALGRYDVDSLAAVFPHDLRERVSAGYMLLTGVGLGIAWIAQWAGVVFGGVKPNLGEAGFQLVAAMDLSFMVPYFILGGVLLWRHRPWGYVVAPIIMTQGALYTLVLAVNSARMAATGGAGGGEVLIWATWTAVGLAALALLMTSARERVRTT